MSTVRTLSLAGVLLALSLGGCDDDPLAPDAPRFAAGGGRTVAAPSNLTATALSSSQMDVAWQDNSDNEGGFEVWVAITGASAFTLWSTTGPNVTKASFTGISAEQEYCAEARAFTTLGKSGKIASYSGFSSIACASTALPPSAPLNVNATPLYSDVVSVWWFDNSNNEDGFRVERSVDAGVTWTIAATTKAGVTYLEDYGRAAEQQVCYRVIAFNGHGDSSPASPDCTMPPAAPSGLTAMGVATPAIDLTWTDNSTVEEGYQVLRSPDDFYSFAIVATVPANSTRYHDATATGNTKYWYAVRATKDNGYSSRSNTVSVIAATTVPNAPSGTNAVPLGSRAIQVSWADNSGNEDGFRVERSLDDGATWDLAGTTGGSDYSPVWFMDADRASDQQVCYRVLAFNGLGVSAPSNTACATPVAAPSNLVATTTAGLAIDLTWTDNSSVEDSYVVQRWYCDYSYEEPYCYYITIATLGRNSTRYQDAELIPGEYYTYIVIAVKDGSPSDASNEASAFSSLPPAAPSNLTATAVAPSQIDLAWTDNATDAQYFVIERCVGAANTCDDASFVQLEWTYASPTTFSDVSVLSGTTYTYRVRAYDGQLSDPSNVATATTP